RRTGHPNEQTGGCPMKYLSIRAGSAAVLCFTLLIASSAARADCQGTWDIGGEWLINQGGNEVRLILEQDRNTNTISGSAQWSHGTNGFSGSELAIVHGKIAGREITLDMDWRDGKLGAYAGAVNDDGSIGGTTFDRGHPGVTAGWQGDHPAKCI